jgi:hypothetical protein
LQDSIDFQFQPNGGLRDTKFGKGFQRKSANNIANPMATMTKDHELQLLAKADKTARVRAESIREKDSSVNYNFITGQAREELANKPVKVSRAPIRIAETKGMGPESSLRGRILLRESLGRFHEPQPSGVKHDYRQHVLVNEGCFEPRASSILQLGMSCIRGGFTCTCSLQLYDTDSSLMLMWPLSLTGKKDLPSTGIEDQFSKAEYEKIPERARVGLYEARQASVYTPRKQARNPSAIPEIVSNWTKTIDINNRTMRAEI